MRRIRLIITLLLASAGLACAHIGSPDTFFEGNAGPYRLLVTIRLPGVIPGVAEIEIRSATPDVREVRITPLRLTGDGSKYPPTPDLTHRSKDDPQFFTGTLWLMELGSCQVRVLVDGDQGKGELSVPVPVVASRTLTMQKTKGVVLALFGLLLSAGLVGIIGAGVREGKLDLGIQPSAQQRQRARIAMAICAGAVVLLTYLGNRWWTAEAGSYSLRIYRPPPMTASLDQQGGLLLRIQPENFQIKPGDLLPDHRHLMHMYLIRLPEMERVWHLHPEPIDGGDFVQKLPAIPAGHYQIYSDIVLRSGFPVTTAAEIDMPELAGARLTGDDTAGAGPPLAQADPARTVAQLADGWRMVWDRDAVPLASKRPAYFRFHLENQMGAIARDLEPYMGMPGHAAFISTDRTVFAHVHPSGTVPMAALRLADPQAAHAMHATGLPPVVSFPYGFPKPGNYRIVVQMKRAGKVETGIFDARVEQADLWDGARAPSTPGLP